MEPQELVEKKGLFGIERRKYSQVEIDEGLDKLSYYLDEAIPLPGTGWRFGVDALIGLIPNVGDTLTSLMSFYILIAGVRYGVPKITLLRMAFNIGLDYVVGAIPFLGDAFDFFWKSNKRNIDLIRDRATGRDVATTGDYIFVFVIIGVLIGILVGSIIVSVLFLSTIISFIWQLFS
jgi:hypothetical protein